MTTSTRSWQTLGGAFILLLATTPLLPSAAACDEASVTCFGDGFPEGYAHECEAHLVTARVEAWINCATGLSLFAGPMGFVESSAPTIAPGGFVRVDVTVRLLSGSNSSERWNFRAQQDAAGVAVSGSTEMSGMLTPSQPVTTFNFTISADAMAAASSAVVGVVLWDSVHQEDFGWLGVNIAHSGALTMFEWVALVALIVALVALVLAFLAWRRSAQP